MVVQASKVKAGKVGDNGTSRQDKVQAGKAQENYATGWQGKVGKDGKACGNVTG